MKVLLDTHAFVWHVAGAPEESKACREVLLSNDNQVLVSIACCWEMAIKLSTQKLDFEGPIERYVREALALYGFQLLGIELAHLSAVESMPFHHRDPFDRMLVAQALVESVPIVSRDPQLDAYGVQRIW
ncbi:MAG TPA: type II toxin-antitoxin system VapC family toxin [Phycisphaerales bacterium]|nr:type II toxin-antitoxin system VapC family toxin [Phycisphaerales bacterium]